MEEAPPSYYQQHKEHINARLRETYDKEKRRARYEATKWETTAKMREAYMRRRTEKNRELLEEGLEKNPASEVLKALLSSKAYAGITTATIQSLVKVETNSVNTST